MWIIDVHEPKGSFHFRHELHAGVLSVGRDRQCDVVLPSSSISRRHGQIEVRDNQLYYRDLNSFNGSSVNGRRIRGEVAIGVRSRIEFGGFVIMIEPDPALAGPARFTVTPDVEPETRPLEAQDVIEKRVATVLLAQQIRSIRSHRVDHQQRTVDEKARIDVEWRKMIIAARQLETELTLDPRVQHFTVSRDNSQLTLKIADASKNGGFAYFILSRRDPDAVARGTGEDVWLREFGERDCHFHEPREALDELVKRVAARLA